MAEVQMADGEGMQPLPRTLHSMNAYLGYAGRGAESLCGPGRR